MVSSTAIIVVGLLAALAPWFYGRGQMIAMIIRNRPGSLPSKNAFSTFQVLYEDTVRNCEDAAIDEASGFALLSCDPGRDYWNTVMGTFIDAKKQQGDIYIYHYARPAAEGVNLIQKLDRSGFPEGREFHPLGIEYHKSSGRLFVVNHGLPPSIEVFKTQLANDKLIYDTTFQQSALNAPNSVHALSNHELLVTNDHYVPAHANKIAAVAETYLGLPGGSVNYVNLETNEVKVLARVPFANGVVQLNDSHVAVASTSTVGIRIYEWEGANKTLTLTQTLKTPFLPDNLSVDAAGNLLIAGHPFPPLVEKMAKTNHHYALDGIEVEGKKPASERPRSPSAVMAWDRNADGVLKTLYVGDEYDAGCTAVRDVKRKVGILTGLYGRGVLVWKE